MPHKRAFISALLFTALHYLAVVSFVASLFLLILQRDEQAAYILAGAIGASGLTWLISFMKRRSARCPLCKGTPYLNTGALTHRKATRILPFNHGTSALLSSLAMQRFRCMYCGTRFDLLKRKSER